MKLTFKRTDLLVSTAQRRGLYINPADKPAKTDLQPRENRKQSVQEARCCRDSAELKAI